jgi:glycosyltransferase involved in cell wall biosynthesis
VSGRDKPFVSVILPVLNEGEFIERCVRSLMENTYNPDKVEILVFDGGSTDDTRQIVTRLTEEFPCIQLLDKNLL